MRLSFRAFAVIVGVAACGAGSACHDPGHAPAVSPSLGLAGSSAELDIGAPAIRFSMKPEPLLGLTASDGTGLRLAAMTAQAVVDGSVAFTELRLTFDNPESRTLEGRFRIALPPGASLQRFAMKIGEQWQESEVVELAAAREAYEDFLHRKQDPALLESSGGNEFSARVFPIPANGRKELVISYVQELRQAAYVLPLRGLPEVGRLDAQVNVLGAPKQPPRLALSNDKPSADLVVDLAAASGDRTTAIRAGELVVARVKPQAESKPDPLAATIVLVDTSASRAIGFEEELRTVSVVVGRAAAANGQLTVATFDQQITPIYDGAATSFGAGDLAKIRAHGALGASNLQRALEWAGAAAKKGARKRIVLVTDGVATAGATDAKGLTATVSSLRASGIERLDAVATGGVHDDAALLKLVRNLLPHDGVVAQASDAPEVIARRLDEATRSGVAVQIEGASWAWPTKLDGVQAGDELSIYAEVPVGKPVKVALDGKPAVVVEPRVTARPLVERVVAQAQIASLLERELQTQQDLKKEITALAVRHRVLTPYTAMLVLETEADYARFRIDRRSPPEVLAIDDGRIIKVARAFRSASAAGPIELAETEASPIAKPKDRRPGGRRPAGGPPADPSSGDARRAEPRKEANAAPPPPPKSAAAPTTPSANRPDADGLALGAGASGGGKGQGLAGAV
ncbi:MAG TPA: VIT domain-containing protein, partial [Labilithrix sp.]|nr:VIT domain-containing protein [Labilithrix sp.]